MFSIATVKVFNILSSVDREKVKDEIFTNFCYCLVPFSFSFEARWDVRPYLFWQLKLKKFTLTAIKSWEVQLVLSSTKLNKILIELNLGCGLSSINAMFSLIKLNQKQSWTKLKCIVEITIVTHLSRLFLQKKFKPIQKVLIFPASEKRPTFSVYLICS